MRASAWRVHLASPVHLTRRCVGRVWPVSALFGTLVVVWAYYRYGRLATMEAHHNAKERGEKPPNMTQTPFPVMVGKGALHCGSGCMLGDVAAEWLAFLVPGVAVWFGWQDTVQAQSCGLVAGSASKERTPLGCR